MQNFVDTELEKINVKLEALPCRSDALFSGKLGMIIYYLYLSQRWDSELYESKAQALLLEIFENLQRQSQESIKPTATLSTGLAGLGISLLSLEKDNLLNIDIEDTLQQFDETIYQDTLKMLKKNNLDCLSGALSGLYYFSFRTHIPQNHEYLNNLLKELLLQRQENIHGFYFINQYINQKNNTPNNINIGLAHGMIGILNILIEISKQEPFGNQLKSTIEGGLNYLLAYEQEVDFAKENFSFFPNSIENAIPQHRKFIGWCYGDLGMINLLYNTANRFQKTQYSEKAHYYGSLVSKRTINVGTTIADPFFCHGSCSMALMFKNLYRKTSQSFYKEAMYYWETETLNYLIKNNFQILSENMTHSLLYGYTGVGLALMSLDNPKNKEWEKLVFL